jgi:hypothetical protein
MTENKKYAAAAKKPTLEYVPRIALYALGAAMADGAYKYGKFNWRETDVNVDIFIEAMQRHLAAYAEGEDYATDSGIHHLAHVMAGAAIVLDGIYMGVLTDTRLYTGKSPVDEEAEKVYRESE